jgi:hypothetical protein
VFGLINIIGSFFGITFLFNYPGTFAVYASLGRSRVAYNAKAATLLYGVFCRTCGPGFYTLGETSVGAITHSYASFLLTPLLATLGSIIFAYSGFGLINYAAIYSIVMGVREKRLRLEFVGFFLSFLLVFVVRTPFLLLGSSSCDRPLIFCYQQRLYPRSGYAH